MRLSLLALLLAVVPARADGGTELSAAYTLVAQVATEEPPTESWTGSLDLLVGWLHGSGRLDVYVEGNSSLSSDGVAARLPESNADAGSAVDADGAGRLQISELKYGRAWSDRGMLTFGLLDPTIYLDATRIANDENLQFFGAPFVNNPTIEFPDYALGLSGQIRGAGDRRHLNVVLASSSGLADSPNLSYDRTFDVTDDGKGLFAGAEAAWSTRRYLLRTGAWVNTAGHEALAGPEDAAANYGVYAAIGGSSRRGVALNARLGLADPEVSLAALFTSVSAQWEWERRVLGVAVARTWLSSRADLPDSDDTAQLEAYLRIELAHELYLTPSVQYLVHSRFDASPGAVGDRATLLGLRLHHIFARRE